MFFGTPITAGGILTPGMPGPPGPNVPMPGPLPPPGIEVTGPPSPFGAVPGGLGIMPGPFGFYELDALSYGRDKGDELVFSVDDFAMGVPGPMPPDVFSEGIMGAAEASADKGPSSKGPWLCTSRRCTSWVILRGLRIYGRWMELMD